MYFVSHAQAGLVNVPGMAITMPRDGTVQSLVKTDGVAAKGAPLATFSTSMLDVLKGHLDDNQLQPAKVEELFGKQMTGTLTSPCDCIVTQQLVADGQYASKGDVIFQLVPRAPKPTSKRASPIASSATCAQVRQSTSRSPAKTPPVPARSSAAPA